MEFWKRSLIIPYLDSIITSLEVRFAEENTPAFALSKLLPAQMRMMSVKNLTETCETIVQFYDLPNIKNAKVLKILIALPCTTCTVERSFSNLRRLKTWLRSTMGENRLNGLAMMSVHRQLQSKFINENLQDFHSKVVEKFTKNPRKLCFN